jgi:bacteriocin-like protein
MKKLKLDPMGLDKATIAKLDDKQLQEIVGGLGSSTKGGGSTGCGSGASTCGSGGSTGCGSGGSTCATA